MTTDILIVEDDPEIQGFLRKGLIEEGYEARTAATAGRAEAMVKESTPDLIILDLMLPGRSGLELCEQLRSEDFPAPILILTARDSIDDRVRGLDAGADDYLVKPFEFAELVARVRALLRRIPEAVGDVISVGDLSLDLHSRTATRGTSTVELTTREFGLLEYMMRRPGQTQSRAQLAEQIWGYNFSHDSNVVDVYIRYLRKKLDEGYDNKLIKTVRGQGYQLNSDEP